MFFARCHHNIKSSINKSIVQCFASNCIAVIRNAGIFLIFLPDSRFKCALFHEVCPASFQTNPTYLAKLIFQMPQNKSTKFMDSVIFTLYNYASNQREEYLLLKLFKTALQEEIKYGNGQCPLG